MEEGKVVAVKVEVRVEEGKVVADWEVEEKVVVMAVD
jgi:hypothetical protein